MSVLEVFGANLRALAERRGSLAQAANDLGISKVQFRRYLNAESFPKPNILKNICNYFGVDARILTEPLTAELQYQMQIAEACGTDAQSGPMHEAIRYVYGGKSFFPQYSGVLNGFHLVFRQSFTFHDQFFRTLLYVKKLQRAQVLRGYDHPSHYDPAYPAGLREYRGMILNHIDGVSMTFYHKAPAQIVTFAFLSPINIPSSDSAFSGVVTLGRSVGSGSRRISRLYMEHVPSNMAAVMAVRRGKSYFCRDEMPPRIMAALDTPLV